MSLVGNTVRLKASFYDFSGNLATPDSVSVTISDKNTKVILQSISGSGIIIDSLGVYHTDYIIPMGVNPIIYEWRGFIEGNPILNRGTMTREYLR